MEASCAPDLVPSFASRRSGAWTEGPSSVVPGAGLGLGSSRLTPPLGDPCLTHRVPHAPVSFHDPLTAPCLSPQALPLGGDHGE